MDKKRKKYRHCSFVQVIDAIEYILPLVFLSEIGDGLNCVCGGTPCAANRKGRDACIVTQYPMSLQVIVMV